MIRTDGKVYEIVKEYLAQRGIDTSTLKIMTCGRGTYHDIILGDRVVGSYEHVSGDLRIHKYEDE